MALRWTAVAFAAISQGFRRITGYKHLWMLKVALGEPSKDQSLVGEPRPDNVVPSRRCNGGFPLSWGHHPLPHRWSVLNDEPIAGQSGPCFGMTSPTADRRPFHLWNFAFQCPRR
jgi:hypothetical protein